MQPDLTHLSGEEPPFSISRQRHQLYSVEEIIIDGVDSVRQHQLKKIFKGTDVVIHLAARVHIMNDDSKDPLAEFRKVNTEGTLNLARQAAESGVRRFIYLSSIKVNGEASDIGDCFSSDDGFIPNDPYGLSKYEAEQGLLALADVTDMDVVIIRPPLVYGPGVKANFLNMMRWVNRGVPLPFAAVQNKRSFVALDNLVDLIMTCIKHPASANQIFLVSDDEDISTTELLQRMGKALGKPARLIPIPAQLLRLGAQMLGKRDVAQRLLGNLQVDISKTKELLDWKPPVSFENGLQKTAQWYLRQL